jgi:nicotinamidase-related amidase
MNVNQLDTKKTGLLFFDLLNVYYHGAPEETKKRMKPIVDNAVRLMDAARQASIPVFYAMANHRKDGQIRSMILTDTDIFRMSCLIAPPPPVARHRNDERAWPWPTSHRAAVEFDHR